MRIAFFVWEFYPRLVGGLGTYAIELTSQFVQIGHDVVMVGARGINGFKEQVVARDAEKMAST